MTDALLAVSALQRSFDLDGHEIHVLQGIDFELQAGEMVALTGASGAGKSTLLHLLGMLDLPDGGSIQFQGQEMTTLSADALAAHRNAHIGFVYQFHHLISELTAVENVALPSRIAGVGQVEAEQQARDLLERVGLTERMAHRPGELSGGEKQRVALGRALVRRPKILLADEPTGNLDEANASDIHDLLLALNEEMGLTTVVATHHSALAARMGRRVHLAEGRLTLHEMDAS
jgi:lipoprotein-releasing system ATP-binding protein